NGQGVEHLKIGDRVLVPLYSGSWRERLVAPAAGLSALPEGLWRLVRVAPFDGRHDVALRRRGAPAPPLLAERFTNSAPSAKPEPCRGMTSNRQVMPEVA